MCAAATLPGVIEYGHDMVYVCYDNKASINAGIQLSSSKRQKAPGIHLALSLSKKSSKSWAFSFIRGKISSRW